MENFDNLYIRQSELNLNIPKSAIVLGVGGIGNWVAVGLSLLGVRKIAIVDPDDIEVHNLNRTLFDVMHIGLPKVTAVSEMIAMKREEQCLVEEYYDRFEDTNLDLYSFECVVDCTDNLMVREYLKNSEYSGKYVKLGYDGLSITIDPNINSIVWEGGDGYTVVPSYVGSTMLIASIIINAIALDVEIKETTIDVKEILAKIFG